MSFSLLMITLIAGVGLSHIIVDGSLFAKWRGLLVEKYKDSKPWVVDLISCYQCSGFWTGVLVGLVLQPINWCLFKFMWGWLSFVLSLPFYLIVTPVIIGLAVSYLSMVGAAFLNWLDAPAMAIASKKNDKT